MKIYPAALGMLLALAACNGGNDKQGEQQKTESPTDSVQTQLSYADEVLKTPANDKYNDTVIEVKTFEELYRNLGSNRTLRLKEGTFTFPASWKGRENLYLDMKGGLGVRGLSNLKIVGGGSKPTKLVQPNPNFKVMDLYKCENIVFENIIAGHSPQKGGCAASVLAFSECKDIYINRSILFGSGYNGIYAYKVANMSCDSMTIRECSTEILAIFSSSHIKFFNCTFTENAEPNGAGKFVMGRSEKILFNGCTISRNASYVGKPWDSPLFSLVDVEELYLKNSTVTDNKATGMVSTNEEVKEINVTKTNNSWQQPG